MIQYMSLYNILVIKLQSSKCPWWAGNCLSCVYDLWGRTTGTPLRWKELVECMVCRLLPLPRCTVTSYSLPVFIYKYIVTSRFNCHRGQETPREQSPIFWDSCTFGHQNQSHMWIYIAHSRKKPQVYLARTLLNCYRNWWQNLWV